MCILGEPSVTKSFVHFYSLGLSDTLKKTHTKVFYTFWLSLVIGGNIKKD